GELPGVTKHQNLTRSAPASPASPLRSVRCSRVLPCFSDYPSRRSWPVRPASWLSEAPPLAKLRRAAHYNVHRSQGVGRFGCRASYLPPHDRLSRVLGSLSTTARGSDSLVRNRP